VANDGPPLTSAASFSDARSGNPSAQRAGGAVSDGLGDFASFFHQHRDDLHRFLWRLSRNAADADDLVQEAFLVAWTKRGQFAGRGSAQGWLRRTAFRLWLNQRTKAKRRATLAEGGPPPKSEVVPADHHGIDDREAAAFLLSRIDAAVDELPDEPRVAFVLFRFEGMTCAEIAATTDAPLKTVETRLRRATELLAVKVRKYRESFPGR
jgi:RNA polymerase sigma-70 factor (ECF subfamily)